MGLTRSLDNRRGVTFTFYSRTISGCSNFQLLTRRVPATTAILLLSGLADNPTITLTRNRCQGRTTRRLYDLLPRSGICSQGCPRRRQRQGLLTLFPEKVVLDYKQIRGNRFIIRGAYYTRSRMLSLPQVRQVRQTLTSFTGRRTGGGRG